MVPSEERNNGGKYQSKKEENKKLYELLKGVMEELREFHQNYTTQQE